MGLTLDEIANISSAGAVLLGKHVACDAFEPSRPLRVITHAHADHMMGLRQSLKTCEKVLMTPATKELIDAMMGPLSLKRGFAETLDYGETLHRGDESITLLPADHILGAAQVLVEDNMGSRIVYTGDFRIEGTQAVDADVVVIEATYGSPACKRPFQEEVKHILASIVERRLKHGPVQVFGYHGKLQEVMQILRQAGVNAPFIMPKKVLQVSKVCEKHGMHLGRIMPLEEGEAKELLNGGDYVGFYHMGSRSRVERRDGCTRIYVSGWEFNSPYRMTAENEYVVALSGHSDFEGLIEYVRLSKPKFVITDNFRVGYAEALAKEIRRRFNISALALPRRRGGM
ncbi:MAG: MBL fold metallo-hydrolase [Candidatus Bathyarchaeia archaeon]